MTMDASVVPTNDTNDIPDDEGVGLSNPTLSEDRRRLLDLVNKLHSTGIQIDIDLPMIAVIGSQSAGKSSLIESISGITLPRAAGTCTRCPTECRLSHSTEPWKCVVSLRFLTDKTGQPLDPIRNESFGPPMFSKSEVEERIRRAQRAILNPSTPIRSFLDGEDEDPLNNELTFSSNCVSLQISGKGIADLSFCDLPGLIASVGNGGHTGDIELVKSLVTSYIRKPSCLILLTVACETDFENQGAHHLAKIHDPSGNRTIGVLTKPDRIQAGDEERWARFIRNEYEPLFNNWYCVKQPNSTTLKQGITWSEARKQENDFFSSTRPWNELEAMYQKFLRTANLTERLSVILSDLISKRLPEIQQELQTIMRQTEDEIRKLPQAPSDDPMSEVMNIVHQFTQDVLRHTEGTPNKGDLLQEIRPEQVRFKRSIRATAPDFRPYEKRHASKRTLAKPDFLKNEDELGDDEDDEDEVNEDGGQNDSEAIFIDEVMDRADLARTRELPDNYPFIVRQAFISTIVEKWRAPASMLFQSTQHILALQLKTLIDKHFESFGQGALHRNITVLISDHLKKRAEVTGEKIRWLLRIEERPYTLNTHYFSSYKDQFLSYYRGSREKDNNATVMKAIKKYSSSSSSAARSASSVNGMFAEPSTPTGVAKIMAGLAEIGMSGVVPTDLPRLFGPDVMDPAMYIMADVRAYFQVAYKRFTDNVPLAIDLELVRGVEEGLSMVLFAGLGVTGEKGARICAELVQEHPGLASKRDELKRRLHRLNTANAELMHI